MEVILSQQCLSLTGILGRGYGYYLQRRGDRFFSVRERGSVRPDGHLRFIVLCAELAQNKLHITDISVSREELKKALYEAHCFIAMQNLRLKRYNANDIHNLKRVFEL